MRKVLEALEGKSNALLESPTGTGKTLCLLCASLAWLKSKKRQDKKEDREREREIRSQSQSTPQEAGPSDHHNGNPTAPDLGPNDQLKWLNQTQEQTERPERVIVYASRTHSQLAKVVKELRSTSYRPKTCVLGSRQQMCIHPVVSKMQGNNQNQACRSLCAKQQCKAHVGVQPWMKAHEKAATDLLDIEDLIRMGTKEQACPFYISKELQNNAELIILPYNYLVDPKIRRSMANNFDWSTTTLIFDEAHNLERVCTDAASFDLTSLKLSQCISEVQGAIEYELRKIEFSGAYGYEESDKESLNTRVESYKVTKGILCNLEKAIASHKLPASGEGLTFPGSYIFRLLAQVEVTPDKYDLFLDQLVQIKKSMEERDEDDASFSPFQRKSYHIPALVDSIKIVQRSQGQLSDHEPPMFDGYRVHISAASQSKSKEGNKFFQSKGINNFKAMPTLSYWCFLPGIAMRELAKLGVESIIVTSGTLAPLQSFSHELQLPFNVSIENPHVVDPHQVWLGIVPVGPSNVRLNSSYRNRDVLEYKNDLGNAIANFSRVIPDGLLVFFPSFAVMNTCIQTWQNPGSHGTSIWEHITRHKQPIVEPRESKLFAQAAEDFKEKLDDPSTSGAIFFGVCRGKASEGLDFSDKAGRGVIITGIPFAMKTDPQVRIKKEVLDEDCKKKNREGVSKLSGDQWYRQQASRAVNQALGRVIRHRHDYGAIILCDERFLGRNAQGDLSKWLRPHINCFDRFGVASASLTRFYKDKKQNDASLPQAESAQPSIPYSDSSPSKNQDCGSFPRARPNAVMDVTGLSSLASKFGRPDPSRVNADRSMNPRSAPASSSRLVNVLQSSQQSVRRNTGTKLTDMLSRHILPAANQQRLVPTSTVLPVKRSIETATPQPRSLSVLKEENSVKKRSNPISLSQSTPSQPTPPPVVADPKREAALNFIKKAKQILSKEVSDLLMTILNVCLIY